MQETKAEEKKGTKISFRDKSNTVKQIEIQELIVSLEFDSIVIYFQTLAGETKKYFLRRTKRDRLVLT